MLVNNVNDLDLIGATDATRSAQYALGRDFSATDFNGFAPGTTFTSGFVFDGNGGLGVNHTISNLTIASASGAVGLFPVLDAGATVRNLNLSNVSITGTDGPNIVGTVAGNQFRHDHQRPRHQQHGERRRAERHRRRRPRRTARVRRNHRPIQHQHGERDDRQCELRHQMNNVGGLVGVVQSGASITNSHALGRHHYTGTNTFAGGLVGRNDGTITNSSSSNAVSGIAGNGSNDIGSAIGGLAGFNSGTISGSFASGPVSGTTASASQLYAVIVGGLVGLNNGPGRSRIPTRPAP